MSRLLDAMALAADSVSFVFAPRRFAARWQERARGIHLRAYAAAKVDPRRPGTWGSLPSDPNDIFASDGARLRGRVRQLCRDFPLFARILDVSCNLGVGAGTQLDAQIRRPGSAKIDTALSEMVEERWAAWCEEADSTGLNSLHDLERLAWRQEMEVGEACAALPLEGNQLRVQMFEPDHLSAYGAAPGQGREVINGVEIDKALGKVLAYWLDDPEHWGSPRRIERQDFIHAFPIQRPGQLRGFTPLAPAVLMAQDIGEFIGAEVHNAGMAARWLGKRKSRSGLPSTAGKNTNETLTREIGFGIIEILAGADDFELMSSNRPGPQFEPFVSFISRLLAVTGDVSYELATGDYRGINYSTTKTIRGDLVQQMRPRQRRFTRQFKGRIAARWLQVEHLARRIKLPGYWDNPAHYNRCLLWRYPEVEGADLLREVRAVLDMMLAGLEAPQDYLARKGKDSREVLEKIKKFKAMAEEIGVDLQWAKSTIKSNPAALGADDAQAE